MAKEPEATTVTNVSDFAHHVKRESANLLTDDRDLMIWFRGHADASWTFEPTILRDEVRSVLTKGDKLFNEHVGADTSQDAMEGALIEHEQQLNKTFRRRAASYLPAGCNVCDIYFLARHYRLPTRLLDWSTNALAAMFFAVVGHPDTDGEVAMIAPNRLIAGTGNDPNRSVLIQGVEFPATQRDDMVVQTIESLFGDAEIPEEGFILPVVPDAVGGRILQQRSCFTLHMPRSPSFNRHARRKFRIPKESKAPIQRELRNLGVTWDSVYPDLEHVATEICAELGLPV